MKYIFFLLSSFVLLSACNQKRGSGNISSETRSTGSFSGIEVSDGIEVELNTGGARVMVEADDNVIAEVETSVNGGVLRIKLRDNTNYSDTHVKVFVTTPDITAIKASSGAEVTTSGQLKSDSKIRIEASSSANIHASLDAPEISIEASSGSELELTGRTKTLTAEASSGSDVKAFQLLSEKATAEAHSGSSIELHASISVNAEAHSGSDIRYAGNPSATIKENSGGSISKQ